MRRETDRLATLALDVPGWPGHRAGHHFDVRLTADDGTVVQRPYSISSAPEDPAVEMTVARLDDGDISPWMVDEARPGDQFELRGPVGSAFTWHADDGGPLLLVAGGAGLAPLRAMVRHWLVAGSCEVRLIVSVRTPSDLPYADELAEWSRAGVAVEVTHTRADPFRRIDEAMLRDAGPAEHVFVCGPTAFAEAAAEHLLDLGHDPPRIRVERFGGA